MTTTDIAVREQGGALAKPSISQLVADYEADLGSCLALASRIVDTEIVPPSFWPAPAVVIGDEVKVLKSWEWDPRRKHPKESAEDYEYRRRTAAATTGGVIHVGATLGHTSYYQSITGIYFVGGRPALMSEEMRAQVIGAGHHLRVTTRTDTVAAVEARRRGDQDEPRQYVFTIEDAIAAGYVQGKGPNEGTDKWGKPKKGGNPKYLTDPATMLVARATTIACRLEFPDVIRGMVAAEIADDDRPQPVEVHAEVVERPTPKATAAAILAAAVPAEQPAPVPAAEPETVAAQVRTSEPAPAAQPAEEPDTAIGEGQWRAINARLLDLGVKGDGQKAARAAVIRAILDAPDLAIAAMTSRQAAFVLDQLADPTGPAVVADVLGVGVTRSAAEQPAAADVDPYADYDPSLEMDGAEAAAEGM